METTGWKLPIDTLQAIWHTAFPTLMHAAWGDLVDPGNQPAKEPCYEAMYKKYNPPTRTWLLDDPALLAEWFECRFCADRVPAELRPDPAMKLSTMAGLTDTYVVYNGGLVLPRLIVPPYANGGPPQPASLSDKLLHSLLEAHLKSISSAVSLNWFVRGTQIDQLRVAASVATARLWRSESFGAPFERIAFGDRVIEVYGLVDPDAPPLTLHVEVVEPEVFPAGGRPKAEDFNPEDGAGHFNPAGYFMYPPPPPPALDGLLASPARDSWSRVERLFCGRYAPRQAYATPCSCSNMDMRLFIHGSEVLGPRPEDPCFPTADESARQS